MLTSLTFYYGVKLVHSICHSYNFFLIILLVIVCGAFCWYKHRWFFLQDDILPKLMTSTGSYDDLFRKEISKYDQICQEIAKNIEAQENLLLQIQVHTFSIMVFLFASLFRTSVQLCK